MYWSLLPQPKGMWARSICSWVFSGRRLDWAGRSSETSALTPRGFFASCRHWRRSITRSVRPPAGSEKRKRLSTPTSRVSEPAGPLSFHSLHMTEGPGKLTGALDWRWMAGHCAVARGGTPVIEEIYAELELIQVRVLEGLAEIPDERLPWKPTRASTSAVEITWHMASAERRLAARRRGEDPDRT